MQELDSKPDGKSVKTTDTLVLAKNSLREWVMFVNQGGNDIWLSLGSTPAVPDKGIYLKAGGGATLLDRGTNPWPGEVRGIADTVASKLTIQEVEVRK